MCGRKWRISKSCMNIKKEKQKQKQRRWRKKKKRNHRKVKKQFIIQNKFPFVFAGWLLFGGVLICLRMNLVVVLLYIL